VKGSGKNDQLTGTPQQDVFYGFGGSDTLIGGEDILGIGGRDKAYGGKGNDTYEIFGEPGAFYIIEEPASGNDWWIPTGRVGPRIHSEHLSKPSPWVRTTESGDQRVILKLPANVENLSSRLWNSVPSANQPKAMHFSTEIHGSAVANTLTGDDRMSVPDYWVRSAISNDRIYGYEGDDTFRYGTGEDAYFGGDGWDTLDLRLAKVSTLANAEPEFLVDLSAGTLVYGVMRGGKWSGYRSSLDSVESVILSRGIDHVRGTALMDIFTIDQGDRAGGDRIWAGDGNDSLIIKRDFAGRQHILFNGEKGFDLLDFGDHRSGILCQATDSLRRRCECGRHRVDLGRVRFLRLQVRQTLRKIRAHRDIPSRGWK
jgi:Ca2+-binding RTX toxin-like protein